MNLDPKLLFYALLGGILPAILWLWFWLKEDSERPEPKKLIIISFLAGMVGVLVVLPLERFTYGAILSVPMLILSWAIIEELVKFAGFYYVGLKSKFFDEPVDALVYIITVAIGFAALENVLFIIKPLQSGNVVVSLLTGQFRFIGATLLHIVASGAIGVAVGLSYYKSKLKKIFYTIMGITVAVVLHTLFNFFIIQSSGELTLSILGVLWLLVIILFLFFEKIKKIRKY